MPWFGDALQIQDGARRKPCLGACKAGSERQESRSREQGWTIDARKRASSRDRVGCVEQLTTRQTSPLAIRLHQWHWSWRQRQPPPAMLPLWIRRPLQDSEFTHLPFTRSLFSLQLVHRPVGRQVPPPFSCWPQLRGHDPSLLGGRDGVGSAVVGTDVGGASVLVGHRVSPAETRSMMTFSRATLDSHSRMSRKTRTPYGSRMGSKWATVAGSGRNMH